MDILDGVKSTISQVLKIPAEPLHLDTKMGELGADSLDVLEIVFALEQKFGIDIPLQAKEITQVAASTNDEPNPASLQFMTIAGIVSVVETRIAAKGRSCDES